VVVVTHDQELIREVCSRVWVMHRGEPVLDFPGTFDEFVEKHPDLAGQHQ
jgi:ATPase subunit of ABC transporter with duplicated ATPase domains